MKEHSEESLILIDEEGQALEDEDDDCQVIEEESTHHDLFVIETNHVNQDNNAALLLDENIEIHRVVMPSNGGDANATKARKSGGGMQCFNCNGAHTLNDCPEPKDQRRISQNRAARYNRNNQGRFHEESTKSFRPGHISDELREALGIRHNELPGWIYRMRRKGFIEGYPPAYLKRSVTELLNFIHADSEEGEVEDQSALAKTIEKEKIVQYPGFNAPKPRNCRDMEPNYRIPPLEKFVQAHQLHLDRIVADRKRLKELADAKKRRKRRAKQEDCLQGESDSSSSSIQVIEDVEAPTDPEVSMDDVASSSSTVNASSPAKKVRREGPVSIGTPVLARHSILGGEKEPEREKPSLEAFAEGVVPFQAKEESSEHKGFFRKIMGMVKGLKKK